MRRGGGRKNTIPLITQLREKVRKLKIKLKQRKKKEVRRNASSKHEESSKTKHA